MISHLRQTHPCVSVNQDMEFNQRHWEIYLRHCRKFQYKNHQHELIPGGLNERSSRFIAPFLSHGLVYLVTETVAEYPYPYFSEKTWKAIVNKKPFMMIGSQHSLHTLREFGFQTFDRWWNEDYDAIKNSSDRIEAVVDELAKMAPMTVPEMEKMLAEMESVLDHNFHHLSVFFQKDLDNIKNNL